MVSKEASKCLLTNSESEVEPAASLALEMKYALDPNRQIKKRNKALQVRFKDICEAQNEQRDKQLSAALQSDKKDAKPISYKTAYRKYMTVPARRSIPNVTKSTGVQTSPDLKKRYQTFPMDRKKGNVIKNASTVDTFKSQNNGFVIDIKDNKDSESSGEAALCSRKVSDQKEAVLTLHTNECMNVVDQSSSGNCSEGCKSNDSKSHSFTTESKYLENPEDSNLEELDYQTNDKAKHDAGPLVAQVPNQYSHSKVLKVEHATVHLPESGSETTHPQLSNSLTETECSQNPAVQEEQNRTVHLNGVQSPSVTGQVYSMQTHCQSTHNNEQPLQTTTLPVEDNQPSQTAVAVSEVCQQLMPHTEVVDLKAQLQLMENLISSSQETIKVLLGVIQELEKGEAHREGLSYRTGQDTANCDTCRNSACIIYSVELDFKQQEDKLQPVLRKLHPNKETQVPSLPYTPEGYSTPKQKSKTESKKHGRWKLWFL
ncbi:inhibitory synaptic factor 2A [Latimeria chalumnae]|uniref:Inhibitory synaptic factor 2A n=1 Tax=Latimeria chalumnae TaxID=7897 RepID=H3AV78_LATCH|nr:PREDICTED: protein FAM196A [Latimeria chalumnae]|eukprot:XP_005995868.1 PREDICTED: protein FAM196A [Latimeria chalumnae]